MAKSFVHIGVRLATASTVTALGLFAAGAAFAANLAPHVDLTQPHEQVYPDSAQLNGEEGSVLVNAYVRPNGRVSKIKVAQSSGFADLDNAAVQSVLNWRFVPAMQDGDPISDWTAVKVVYQLPRAQPQPAPASATQPPG